MIVILDLAVAKKGKLPAGVYFNQTMCKPKRMKIVDEVQSIPT